VATGEPVARGRQGIDEEPIRRWQDL